MINNDNSEPMTIGKVCLQWEQSTVCKLHCSSLSIQLLILVNYCCWFSEIIYCSMEQNQKGNTVEQNTNFQLTMKCSWMPNCSVTNSQNWCPSETDENTPDKLGRENVSTHIIILRTKLQQWYFLHLLMSTFSTDLNFWISKYLILL